MGDSTDKCGVRAYAVEPGTKKIEGRAFCSCYDLEEIEIPNSVNVIGTDAFADCINLKKIEISDVIWIGKGAFRGCSSLKRFKIPNLVRGIGEEAFMDCYSLEEIIFPNLSGIFLHAFLSLLLREPLRAAAA